MKLTRFAAIPKILATTLSGRGAQEVPQATALGHLLIILTEQGLVGEMTLLYIVL